MKTTVPFIIWLERVTRALGDNPRRGPCYTLLYHAVKESVTMPEP